VRGEVAFGLENLGLRPVEIEARTEEALAAVDLDGMADRNPHTLSGGEQQRLILAAVAARRPRAIVLDEPLSMLDGASAREVVRRLDQLRGEGTAVVVFEHRHGAFARLAGVSRHVLGAARSAAADVMRLPEPARELAPFRVAMRGVRVHLGGRAVLDGVDLDLAGGSVVSLVGANGAGKTTLLRALAGLQGHEGAIDREGARPGNDARLGLCFQNPDCQLFNPTVREEILCGLDRGDESAYRSVVDTLGLAPYEGHSPLLLSEGEKKRLALATVVVRPDLDGLCLDEPTLGQDARHAQLVGRIVRRLAAAGRLCVVATHDLEWAAAWSDEIVLLDGGRVIARERPDAVDRRPRLWQESGLRLPERLESTCDAASPSA
jgi:energy-coupling factor transport system ATP-binding protein